MRTALYPGTFDPVTNGHLSLIRRGCQLFDRLLVAVADMTPNPPLFSQTERVAMLREALAGVPQVQVIPFSGLTVTCAQSLKACAVLRGMRAVSDFEAEFQLALMNRRLCRSVETVFLMTDYQWLYTSSTMVKGAASHHADIRGLVPENVEARLREIFSSGRGRPATPCLVPQPGGFAAAPPEELPETDEEPPDIPAATGRRRRTAVYPGTFDPVTSGHLSIIRRALRVFDRVVVAVAESPGKHPLFSLDERTAFLREALADQGDRVLVKPYSGLTMDFARDWGACALVRGLRATGDFEYEFQLALMNRRLRRSVQSVFFMTDYRWLFVSSTIVKAAASHGGSVDGLVPENVRSALQARFGSGRFRQATPCLAPPAAGYGKTAEEEPETPHA